MSSLFGRLSPVRVNRTIARILGPCVVVLLLATVLASPAFAQGLVPGADPSVAAHAAEGPEAAAIAPEAEVPEWFGRGRAWSDWSRMSGAWGTWRPRLQRAGFDVSGAQSVDLSSFAHGAVDASGVGRGLIDFGVTMDLGTLAGLRGWTGSVSYQRKWGGDGSSISEDAQGFSNVDADDFQRVAEAWVEGWIVADRLRVKAGRVDANSEFAFVEHGADFINPSMGFSPTIFVFPTYPSPPSSVNVFTTPVDHLQVNAGIYNGRPALGLSGIGSPFAIVEVGTDWAPSKGPGPGRAAVGWWHQHGTFERVDGTTQDGVAGYYVVADQTIWVDRNAENSRHVSLFVQYGRASRMVTDLTHHVGTGVVVAGLIPGRPDDSVGVTVSTVTLQQPPDVGGDPVSERNVGAFYRYALTGWLALKTDAQVILRPGGDPDRASLVVMTLRMEFTF